AQGQVLSSCETFRTESQVGNAHGHAYAIASVFTESTLRGQGHATALVDALCDTLKQRPRAQVCVLFSEVGASLYESSHFLELPSFDWVAPAQDVPLEARVTLLKSAPPSFSKHPDTLPAGHLSINACLNQLEWHWAREQFYAKALKRPSLTGRGMQCGAVEAVWMEYAKTRELLVLWTNARTAAEATVVLKAGQKVAFDAGLQQVRLWETAPLKITVGKRVSRDEELPMYRSLGPAITEWVDVQRVHWV
ncbi:MAG: GNAT family N-acetyltransferase, partial [Myxococcaceae bacterium]|nr:GNAT family N-acetyltransferase [Myxococcaceae bacterium]